MPHFPDSSDQSIHKPVLVREVIDVLNPQPGEIIVDGTAGGGGHSCKIIERILPGGRLIGLDRDPMMLNLAAAVVSGPNVDLIHASYAQLPEVLTELGIDQVDALLVDLGLSSDQLADRSRGFSFDSEQTLDLRFDTTQGTPAWQLLESLPEEQLAQIFFEFGEERFNRRIAEQLVSNRRRQPIRTAQDLRDVIQQVIPMKSSAKTSRNPATRVFQALRIAVNEELGQLEKLLKSVLPKVIKTHGRVAIISFHSLEDRLVKNAFRDKQRFRSLLPKVVAPSAAEARANPRSRTAKLRAVELL